MAKTTTATVPMVKGEEHHAGFSRALAQALKQMDRDFGPGTYDVDVHFQLKVEVKSPGSVGFYQVTVTTT